MTASIPGQLGLLNLLDDNFFSDHWRKLPVVFRGAADHFLSNRPSPSEIKTLITTPAVHTDGRSVWFLESLHDSVTGVAELCEAAKDKFGWDGVWCDVFLTEGSSSIGAHIDNSDNFSIQLNGTKKWRVATPAKLSSAQRRLRILGEPDVGNTEISDNFDEYILAPGDVLYIPLLWRHWGISDGDSLSVSLVVNSKTVWQVLHSTLISELRHEPAWHEPLIIGPSAARHRSTQLANAVAGIVDSGAIRRTGRKAQREVAKRSERKHLERLDIEMSKVREFIASAPEPPMHNLVLADNSSDSMKSLSALLARKNLKDLLVLVARRFEQVTGAAERELYQACVHALTSQSEATIEGTLTGPDITSWIAVAKQSTHLLPVVRQEDPLAHQLAFFLVPEITACTENMPVPEIRVDVDRNGGLAVPRLSLQITARSATGSWSFTVGADGITADDGAATTISISDEGPGIARLHHIADGPVVIASPSGWLDDHLPTGVSLPSSTPSDVERFQNNFTEGAELLRSVWPGAWAETQLCIERLVPMPWAGLRPHNYSIHAFRGQIVSSPRPGLMAAQTLVHETGHNRMSTLMDLLPLCSNPNERVISPVVNADRPLTAVFQGCYSFAREIYLTSLLIDEGTPEVPTTDIRRYLTRFTNVVHEAWSLLRERAELLPAGEIIVQEVGEILGRVQ